MPKFSIVVEDKIMAIFDVEAENEAEARALAEEKISEDDAYMESLNWQPTLDGITICSIQLDMD
jgi:hypothetical protein